MNTNGHELKGLSAALDDLVNVPCLVHRFTAAKILNTLVFIRVYSCPFVVELNSSGLAESSGSGDKSLFRTEQSLGDIALRGSQMLRTTAPPVVAQRRTPSCSVGTVGVGYHDDMPSPDRNPHHSAHAVGVFATTHWSVVLAAGAGDSRVVTEALEALCSVYWFPLYAYVRRRGYKQHEAEDLVQSFFSDLLKRQSLDRVSPEKGKFRSFLLASLNYFLANELDRASAQKRGGGQVLVSLDAQEAEERYRQDLADDATPDKVFERCWAFALLDQVLAQLAEEFAAAGKRVAFERLEGFLVRGAGEETYAEAARELGQSEEAIKKAVQRMRHRYQELFRQHIAHTVATAAEVDEELRHLCAIMARK
ncbi:MAG: sigma-70 family RNA polymerase sigma factor [Verrucomicrobiales bacterium]|nr:sigma-70 family RNA polymerase sigma factor [Verrucomicrobiales bacterium]